MPCVKPGRPRVDPTDQSVHLNLTLPARVYDELCAKALARGRSVPEVLREQLQRRNSADRRREDTDGD